MYRHIILLTYRVVLERCRIHQQASWLWPCPRSIRHLSVSTIHNLLLTGCNGSNGTNFGTKLKLCLSTINQIQIPVFGNMVHIQSYWLVICIIKQFVSKTITVSLVCHPMGEFYKIGSIHLTIPGLRGKILRY